MINLLEQAVSRSHGAAIWHRLLDETAAAGADCSPGNYDDEDVERLVGAGRQRFDIREAAAAVTMAYHSPRRMCASALGFPEGLADQDGEAMEAAHEACRERGDACRLLHTVRRPPA